MKLTESQLIEMIRESAIKVISEVNKEYDDMHKAKAYDDYLGQNMFKRGWDIVTGKRPEKPSPYTPNEPMKAREAYDEAGNEKEWGIKYPYSEAGYTGEYEGDNEDIRRRSGEFKKLRGEVSGKLAASKRERDSKKSKKNESVIRISSEDFHNLIAESVKDAINEIINHK